MTKYHIEHAYHYSDLATKVTVMISKGWEPVGGMSVCFTYKDRVTYYFQAMVKK